MPADTRDALKASLQDIADHIHWCLSCWMDEESIIRPIGKLLSPDLLNTWESLQKCAIDNMSLEDLFLMAADSRYRFEQVSTKSAKTQRAEILKIKKAIKRLSTVISANKWVLNDRFNDYAFNALEKGHNITKKDEKNVNYDENNKYRRYYRCLQVDELLEELDDETNNMLKNPSGHPLLSNKRGTAALYAFYTNSLCEVTKEKFTRPCFVEVASIANAVLETPADKPITEENVRMNFRNHLKRLEAIGVSCAI